ncbi:MAG: slipin family protein [Bryobacterales bacterium]|nr:slipin family protein [Bryobacterales bacterium]
MLTRQRRFETILEPGSHWLFGLGLEAELHNTRSPEMVSPWADYLASKRADVAAAHFVIVETGDTEVAIVSFDGKLARVVGPGRRVLYWRAAVQVTYERIDVAAEPEVPARLVAPLARLGAASLAFHVLVEDGKRGLVHLDGRLIRELAPGAYAFWTAVAQPHVTVTELRRQTLEVTGQEILTADKVAVRVNVSVVFEVVNAAAARAGVTDVREHLYRTVQIAVRQYLGKRTLEEMLAEKTDLDAAVAETVRRDMEPLGVRVGVIALKDVVLPGDVRDILNQVVTAEKQAQANLIRRREEVASTRSLLNTAKLMGENPILVRLKELEALERIADKVDKITVVGGMNALLERTVKIDTD